MQTEKTNIVETSPTPEFVQALEDRLYEFNCEATGLRDGRSFAFTCHGPGGEWIGGLAGHTWGRCCEIKQVWVAEQSRGLGLGRRLLEAAEAEALRRGCTQVVLTTHSFQAPRFYLGLGFEVVAVLDDYPTGHQHLLLRKRFSGE